MSKKKRSKIMAAVLCATTMAAFYASPQMVYAANLHQTADGTVTTVSGGTNTAINNLEGIESITFGVQGDLGTGGVQFYFDGTGTYGGLVANGTLTATDLYITVENPADGNNYNSNRYSLKNALGIHRQGTGDQAITNIEANSAGHGGMQVGSEFVTILDGTATFTNTTTQSDGGTIAFDGKFDSAQGMTVGNSFTLDGTGKISQVTGIDVQGALTTTGTINSMTIANNQVNGVTLFGNEVTANEVTAGTGQNTYSLTEVGSDVEDIADKTAGIASYTSSDDGNTTFNGKITAYSGVTTNQISNGSDSFRVSDAADTIAWVDEWGDKVSGYDGRITANETAISGLDGRLSTAETEIDSLQTATTGMSYDASSGTKFEKNITATDFVIDADTSLSGVANALTTAEGKISANETAISGLDSKLTTAEGKISANETAISGLDSKLTTAEGKISANETAISGLDSKLTTAEGKISANETAISGLDSKLTTAEGKIKTNTDDIGALKIKTHGFSDDGETLKITTITATTGTVGNVTFNGGVATGLTAINGDSVTVAGTAISKGSFNGVSIANTDGKASINGISIYQDQGDYYVGNVNISDLTSGSGATVDGIVRTPNDESDLSKGYTTTIEGALAVNSATGDTTVTGTVTAKDFVIKDGASLSTVAANLGIAEGEIDTLQVNTANLQGTTLTNMTEIETDKITATEGTIGGISFETVSGVKTIGTADDTINLAGNAISKGSFNGVAIGVDVDNHATFNGVSIYEDTNNDNDVMVGGINLSDLQSGTSTKLEGIVREQNENGQGYTTTIEETLKVNSATHEISNADGSFKVAEDGTVTGTDFVINDNTKLSTVASDVTGLKTATTGMTYTPAADGKEAGTSFAHQVSATNVTTTAGADLNALSETVGDETDGLVKDVTDLGTKTTNLSADGSTLTNMTSIEATTGKLGDMTFSGYSIGSAGDTITVAGAAITSNSFNNVDIYQQDDDYYLGDINVSELQNGNTEITNKLRGITYSNEQGNDYTMTFAGVMSVSTTGEYEFNYKGNTYGLDDLINTVDVGTLEQVKELNNRVENLEDKTTGIEFNKETGETTISQMNGTDNDNDGINDTFTKGDNFFAVNENGITANGDTFVKGEGGSVGGGSGAGIGTEKSDHFVDGNQTVGGDQYVNGDVNATNGNYTGNVGVGGDVFIDANGDNVLNEGEISLSGVSGKVDSVSDKVDSVSIKVDEVSASVGDVSSVNSNIAGDSNDDGENDLAGAVNNEYEQRVEADNALNERINSIDNRMGELEDRIDKVGAMAAAIANLRTMGYDPTAPTEIAVGIGQYRSETGAALGLFHYPNRDFMLSMSVSTSGDEVMGGIGATWKFGRKSPEKVAAEKAEKAKAAKLKKAEAIKEAARAKKVAEQQERHAELAAKEAAAK